jgi:hypothetical protein
MIDLCRIGIRPERHCLEMPEESSDQSLAGRLDEAHARLAAIRRTLPRYRVDDSSPRCS